MRWLDGITDSMDMCLSKLWETLKDRDPGVLQFTGSKRVRHNFVTDNNLLSSPLPQLIRHQAGIGSRKNRIYFRKILSCGSLIWNSISFYLGENGYMYMMAESLCCSPETTTILLIGCTPIWNKMFKVRGEKKEKEIPESLKSFSGSYRSHKRGDLKFYPNPRQGWVLRHGWVVE